MSAQLAFLVVPTSAAEVIEAHLDLIRDALEDATCWRADLEDDETAEAYQAVIAAIDATEEP
jgi:hypothetical protein